MHGIETIRRLNDEAAAKEAAIAKLQGELADTKAKIFDTAKAEGFLELLKVEFQSSSVLTPQFAEFFKVFKSEFGHILKAELGATRTEFRRGHFEVFGQFQLQDGRVFRLTLGDVRWSKSFYVRTLPSWDFNGSAFDEGPNLDIRVDSLENFKADLRAAVL